MIVKDIDYPQKQNGSMQRAGTDLVYSGSNDANEVAWFSTAAPQPVAQLLPNAFGLYDMSGGSYEFVWDRYDGDTIVSVQPQILQVSHGLQLRLPRGHGTHLHPIHGSQTGISTPSTIATGITGYGWHEPCLSMQTETVSSCTRIVTIMILRFTLMQATPTEMGWILTAMAWTVKPVTSMGKRISRFVVRIHGRMQRLSVRVVVTISHRFAQVPKMSTSMRCSVFQIYLVLSPQLGVTSSGSITPINPWHGCGEMDTQEITRTGLRECLMKAMHAHIWTSRAAEALGLSVHGMTLPVPVEVKGLYLRYETSCGNGSIDGDEECDDGNLVDGAQHLQSAISSLDCAEIHFNDPSLPDGTYLIDPDGVGGEDPFEVYCDMTTDGGGWTDPDVNPLEECPGTWVYKDLME